MSERTEEEQALWRWVDNPGAEQDASFDAVECTRRVLRVHDALRQDYNTLAQAMEQITERLPAAGYAVPAAVAVADLLKYPAEYAAAIRALRDIEESILCHREPVQEGSGLHIVLTNWLDQIQAVVNTERAKAVPDA